MKEIKYIAGMNDFFRNLHSGFFRENEYDAKMMQVSFIMMLKAVNLCLKRIKVMKCKRKWLFILLSLFFIAGIIWRWRERSDKDSVIKEISQDIVGNVKDNRKFQYQKAIKKNKRVSSIENRDREVLEFAGRIRQENVEQIGNMQSLKELAFFITDESIDLSPLSNLKDLEKLEIRSDGCKNLNTKSLGELKQLKKIVLDACEFDISFIAKLTNLEDVVFTRCLIEDITVFQNMTSLKRVGIEYITDADLNYLHELKNLEDIDIGGSKIRNIEGLKGLTKVKSLALESYEFIDTENVFANDVFVGMDQLTFVYIRNIKIKDITPLTEAKNLSDVTLINADITDIEPLSNLKKLEELWIVGNQNAHINEQAEKYFTNGAEVHILEEEPY